VDKESAQAVADRPVVGLLRARLLLGCFPPRGFGDGVRASRVLLGVGEGKSRPGEAQVDHSNLALPAATPALALGPPVTTGSPFAASVIHP
jgi:hypothetical protein